MSLINDLGTVELELPERPESWRTGFWGGEGACACGRERFSEVYSLLELWFL